MNNPMAVADSVSVEHAGTAFRQVGVPVIPDPKVLRVMIVEDEPMNAAMLAEVLEDMGHSVCAIEATEAGAVIVALECKPDLMLVDATLAAGSGVAAVAEILRTWPVPHLFMTGNVSLVIGMRPDTVVLHKPFCIADIGPAIKRALITAKTRTG